MKSISIKQYLLHPLRLFDLLRWVIKKQMLRSCGDNTFIDYGFRLKEPQNISIGKNVIIENNCLLVAHEFYHKHKTGYSPQLIIGNNVRICFNSFISCLNKIKIGDGCLLGSNVYIADHSHGRNSIDECETLPFDRRLYSKGPICIGKNVWIGRNVCIMPNVRIGDFAVIGANSVVTHDIPSYSIAAGCPARVIKKIT